MTLVASTIQGLLLICLISVVYGNCDETSCLKSCRKDSCPASLDCGETKSCAQFCIGRSCPAFTCDNKECEQTCTNCTNKLVCNAERCIQTCTGSYCKMECGAKTKVCKQICQDNSTCEITCNKEKSQCDNNCQQANCTGLAKEAEEVSSCDDKNCTRRCTGDCKGKTLRCEGKVHKECHLSCENGCKMECDSDVKVCSQTCIGDTKCVSVCHASKCSRKGHFSKDNVGSSAIVCGLNSIVSAFFSCLMILLVTNV